MKKKKLSLFVLLFVIAIAGVFVVGTYAKYTSEINKTGNATVAKWDFVNDNNGNAVSMAIQLPSTDIDEDTLVDGKIAPGTAGSFGVSVVNTNTEVGTNYSVSLDSITNKPTNLKFYKTRSGSAGAYTYSNEIVPGDATNGVVMSGTLTPGDSVGAEATIYWVWEYEIGTGATLTTNDGYDTTDGATANSLTVGVTITGTQVRPAAE